MDGANLDAPTAVERYNALPLKQGRLEFRVLTYDIESAGDIGGNLLK